MGARSNLVQTSTVPITNKRKVLGGKATVYTLSQRPDTYYLRVLRSGTKRYVVRAIPEASSLDEAEAGALDVFLSITETLRQTPPEGSSPRARTSPPTKTTPSPRPATGRRSSRAVIAEEITRFIAYEEKRNSIGQISDLLLRMRTRVLKTLVIPFLETKGVKFCDEISLTTFQDYPFFRSGIKQQTLNNELKVVSMFVRTWLGRQGLVPPNLVVDKTFIPKQKLSLNYHDANPSINAGDWLIINRFIRKQVTAAKDWQVHSHYYWRQLWWCFTYLAKTSGCRPKELINLKWKDIDIVEVDDRYIVYLFIKETKTGVSREVPCWSRTAHRLLHFKQFQQDYCQAHDLEAFTITDLVFGNPNNYKLAYVYSNYGRMWNKMIAKIKPNLTGNRFSDRSYTIYSLRSTFIENHLSRGVDAYLVARIAGHDIKTMRRFYDRSDVRSRSRELTTLELPNKHQQKSIKLFDNND